MIRMLANVDVNLQMLDTKLVLGTEVLYKDVSGDHRTFLLLKCGSVWDRMPQSEDAYTNSR